MIEPILSRRGLLRSSLAAALSADVLDALQHAHETKASGIAKLAYFEAKAAADVEALAATIIPSDDTPGAREAGAIYFIDRALATFDSGKREEYSKGLAAIDAKRKALYPASESIASLTGRQCEDLVRAIEGGAFFETLRTHVVIGFLANPEWGGNRGKAGWKLIGYEDAGAFQHPFGYYDSPENAG